MVAAIVNVDGFGVNIRLKGSKVKGQWRQSKRPCFAVYLFYNTCLFWLICIAVITVSNAATPKPHTTLRKLIRLPHPKLKLTLNANLKFSKLIKKKTMYSLLRSKYNSSLLA